MKPPPVFFGDSEKLADFRTHRTKVRSESWVGTHAIAIPKGVRGVARTENSRVKTIETGWRRGCRPSVKLTALVGAACLSLSSLAHAETISGALSRAYSGNPDINQQRASVRASDENVPRAMSGYRPRVTATADAGRQWTESDIHGVPKTIKTVSNPRGVGLSVTQNLWNGNRTENGVRQAESGVFAARETMRQTEQTVLQNGATAYMNVLRDTAILNLRKNNISVIEEQLRQTRNRFQVGEVTRTDVAQAEASLAQARSDYFAAQSNLQSSVASYRQVIGVEPKRLEPARPIEALLPKSMVAAVQVSQVEHPAVQAALHNVDAQALNVKVVEGELYPTIGVTGSVAKRYDPSGLSIGSQSLSASIVGSISVPIYEGGEVYARARQAKELLGQARLQADLQRDAVRALVVSTWGQLETAKAQIVSGQAAVTAAEIALNGVREEAKVGQRTTLDVLNAQQALLNTRVLLVTAQRDRVVASYAVMAATGRLSAQNLNLKVANYDARAHFDQVKDKWIGLRTPDGR